MDELLAIILIVLLCCFLFFAWLFALATCPDRMVNLISGAKQSSSPISRASEDLLGGGEEKSPLAEEGKENLGGSASLNAAQILQQQQKRRPPPIVTSLLVRSRSIPSNRSNGFIASSSSNKMSAEKRSNSKKLSVVPEADEQLTVTSIKQCLRQNGQSNNSSRSPLETTKKPHSLSHQPEVEVKKVLINRKGDNGFCQDSDEQIIYQQPEEENRQGEGGNLAERRSEPPNIHKIV